MNEKLENVIGQTVRMRLINPSDADYVVGLRLDPKYNKHLSAVDNSVEKQREWIERYKLEESLGNQYYYIIERLDGTRCGTVRLYDFRKDSFCWGSWILDHNKTRYAALESAMLVYQLAFEQIGYTNCHFEVRKENSKVISFHKKFGAEITHEDELNYYFNLSRNVYNSKRERLSTIVRKST